MNKREDFTIEGSIPLKEAFVKESGLMDNYITPWENFNYLTSRSRNKKGFANSCSQYDKHFKLPQQWDEALEYVKDYFEEKPKFKAGDYVCWSGNIPTFGRLKGIPHNYGGFCWALEKNTNSEGTHNSCNEEYLRLMTEEEILNYLQKEFTERTGIDVGSKVDLTDVKSKYYDYDNCIWGNMDYSWRPCSRKLLSFKLIENTLITVLSSNTWDRGIYIVSDYVELAKHKLTFGGNEVKLEKVSSGIRICCASETGTLSQMERIYDFITGTPSFNFGSVKLTKVEFPDVNLHLDDITVEPDNIKIGCTTGTWKEFCNILKEAKKLENE